MATSPAEPITSSETHANAQQYQNQEEIIAEQQQLLQHQQRFGGSPQSMAPSAPVLSEDELLQMNEAHNASVQQQPQQAMTEEQRQRYQSHLQLQLNQISAANAMGMQQFLHQAADNMVNIQARHHEQPAKYQRNFVDGDFEFVSDREYFMGIDNLYLDSRFQLKFLSFDDLQTRLKNIDVEMEREIDDLNRKYGRSGNPFWTRWTPSGCGSRT